MTTNKIKKGSIVEYVGTISEFYNSLATVLSQEEDMYKIKFRNTESVRTVERSEIQQV